ncbi:PqqD family protein [Thiolapillus sp.]
MAQSLSIPDHIRWRKVAGEAVIVDQSNAELIVLNTTGCRVWELLAQGLSVADIASCLHQEFEVEQDQAVADVEQCLVSLQELGVVTITGQT